MSRLKAALSLYIALAVHLLGVLLLVFGLPGSQLPAGRGHGLGGAQAPAPESSGEDPISTGDGRDPVARTPSPTPPLTLLGLASRPLPLPSPTASMAPPTAKAHPAPVSTTGAAAPGDAAAGGGRGGYMAQVRACLNRNRRSLVGIQAGAHSTVAFTIDAAGRALDIRLVDSSGIASLDQEAVEVVRRSSPFPVPEHGQTLRLSVPISVEPSL